MEEDTQRVPGQRSASAKAADPGQNEISKVVQLNITMLQVLRAVISLHRATPRFDPVRVLTVTTGCLTHALVCPPALRYTSTAYKRKLVIAVLISNNERENE